MKLNGKRRKVWWLLAIVVLAYKFVLPRLFIKVND